MQFKWVFLIIKKGEKDMKKFLLILLISMSVISMQATVKADMPHVDKLCVQAALKIVQLPTKYGKTPMRPKPRRTRIMPLLHNDPFTNR